MADFSISQQGAGSISDPVATRSPGSQLGVASAVTFGAQVASIFATSRRTSGGFTAGQIQKQNENKVVAGHLQTLEDLADAVSSGGIQSGESSARARAVLGQAVADNPQFSEALLSAHNSFSGKSGVGAIITTGTQEQQDTAKLREKALLVGAVSEKDTAEEQAADLEVYRSDIQTVEAMNRDLKDISVRTARLGETRDKSSLKAQQLTNQIAETKARVNIQLDQVYAGASRRNQNLYSEASIDPDLTNAQRALRVDEIFMEFVNQIEEQGVGADNTTLEGYINRAQRFRDVYHEIATGELDATSSKNRIQTLMNQETLAIISQVPEVIRAMSIAEMGPMFALGANPFIQKAAMDAAMANPTVSTDPFNAAVSSDAEGSTEGKITFYQQWMPPWMKMDNEGGTNEAQAAEVLGSVQNILKGITPGTSAEVDPVRYQPVLSFLANPVSRDYFKRNKGELMALRLEAGTVLQQELSNTLLKAIRHKVDFSLGDRVVMENGVARVSTPDVFRQRELKRTVETHLNMYIRGMSHLGDFEYEQIWEQLKPVLFPGQTTLDQRVEEVSVEDFNDIPGF